MSTERPVHQLNPGEDAPWLTEDERDGWLFLTTVFFSLPGKLETQLQRDSGLSFVEYMVLAMLSESPEHALSMSELARKTSTLAPRLSRVVTRLENSGFVTRTISSEDRRVYICHLEAPGLEKVQQAAPGHVMEVRRQIFDRLGPRQAKQLAKIGESVLGDKPSEVVTVKKTLPTDQALKTGGKLRIQRKK